MAACDLLDQCQQARQFVTSNNKAGAVLWAGDEFSCSSGSERDLVCSLIEWASEQP